LKKIKRSYKNIKKNTHKNVYIEQILVYNTIDKENDIMKIYDKEMFRRDETLKSTILLFVVFILGFAVGYIANMDKTHIQGLENTIQEQNAIIQSYQQEMINSPIDTTSSVNDLDWINNLSEQ